MLNRGVSPLGFMHVSPMGFGMCCCSTPRYIVVTGNLTGTSSRIDVLDTSDGSLVNYQTYPQAISRPFQLPSGTDFLHKWNSATDIKKLSLPGLVDSGLTGSAAQLAVAVGPTHWWYENAEYSSATLLATGKSITNAAPFGTGNGDTSVAVDATGRIYRARGNTALGAEELRRWPATGGSPELSVNGEIGATLTTGCTCTPSGDYIAYGRRITATTNELVIRNSAGLLSGTIAIGGLGGGVLTSFDHAGNLYSGVPEPGPSAATRGYIRKYSSGGTTLASRRLAANGFVNTVCVHGEAGFEAVYVGMALLSGSVEVYRLNPSDLSTIWSWTRTGLLGTSGGFIDAPYQAGR